MAVRDVAQLGMDEQIIEDADVEAALEEREKRRESLGAVRAKYELAHEKALGEIAKLELPEGAVARVGRFRVTRQGIEERSVAFTTKASTRIRISVAED